MYVKPAMRKVNDGPDGIDVQGSHFRPFLDYIGVFVLCGYANEEEALTYTNFFSILARNSSSTWTNPRPVIHQ